MTPTSKSGTPLRNLAIKITTPDNVEIKPAFETLKSSESLETPSSRPILETAKSNETISTLRPDVGLNIDIPVSKRKISMRGVVDKLKNQSKDDSTKNQMGTQSPHEYYQTLVRKSLFNLSTKDSNSLSPASNHEKEQNRLSLEVK
jgi:hypothetical protein